MITDKQLESLEKLLKRYSRYLYACGRVDEAERIEPTLRSVAAVLAGRRAATEVIRRAEAGDNTGDNR